MAASNPSSSASDALLTWLSDNGGFFHPRAAFAPVPSGYAITAKEDIPADAIIVSCPFSLAVTPDVAATALKKILKSEAHEALGGWTERQLICSYLCLHWIVERDGPTRSALLHDPYLLTLPDAGKLRTSLHFTAEELEEFRGTNIYAATIDREREWRHEWEQCLTTITEANEAWGKEFTWERYLTSATYLSSRAFPSTILADQPSLTSTSESYPVLLPGVDSLNHARAHPVSWLVSRDTQKTSALNASNNSSDNVTTSAAPIVSLVIHKATPAGGELYNNYGGKPNSELILGYGFSIADNPEDSIVLAIGGVGGGSRSDITATSAEGQSGNRKWEVGRDMRGAEAVWEEVLMRVKSATEEDLQDDRDDDDVREPYEDKLEAAQVLVEMVQTLLDKLPPQEGGAERAKRLRPEVAGMLHDYISGQRDILEALLKFACDKEKEAVEDARALGIELVFD